MRKTMVTLLAVGLLVSGGTAAAGERGVVRTDAGLVRGTIAPDHELYLGIPFAAPPVGGLRWRSPQPVRPWTGVRDATKPGSACAQSGGGGAANNNEDCLYLNVTTPSRHGRKPVMLWLHGGGNSYLSAEGFGAARLAAQGDVVVVTTNFRLGVFGFLGHPGLPDSGAYGIEDQQAALRWVQRNATAFGGDPDNVTVFGESGGAFDVCAQLAAPGSAGLFDRAIAQSGGCSIAWPDNGVIHGFAASTPWVSQQRAETDGTALATQLGCSSVECMRALPASAFTAVDRGLTPVVYGNKVLPLHPVKALEQGRFNRVPVIWGNTRDEGRLTAAFSPKPFTEEQYQQLLAESYGDKAAEVGAEYPSSEFGSPALAWGAVLTDAVWACNQLADDRLLARRVPTYAFEFADRGAPTGYFGGAFTEDIPAGAFHSSEIAYLFDVAGFEAGFTPAQQRLADRMIGYWTRFARTGDPNGRGLPDWPRFRDGNVQSLAPDAIRQVDGDQEHNCAFWAGR